MVLRRANPLQERLGGGWVLTKPRIQVLAREVPFNVSPAFTAGSATLGSLLRGSGGYILDCRFWHAGLPPTWVSCISLTGGSGSQGSLLHGSAVYSWLQVLARGAPSYVGQVEALFHPKDRGWRVLGHPLQPPKFKWSIVLLKGTVAPDFFFQVFLLNQLPRASDNRESGSSIFRKFAEILATHKGDHQCQLHRW